MADATPSTPVWTPGAGRVRQALLTSFMRAARDRGGPEPGDYQALWAWSVTDPASFWSLVWDFCEVRGHKGRRILLDGDRMPGARWFPDAELNYAENLLRRRDDTPALVFRGEDGRREEWSHAELRRQVGRLQAGLRGMGLQPGDRVAAVLPHVPEAIAAMLAVTSLGGVWSSCSPDFGAAGILDRFGQIGPRLLFVADGYLYKGRPQPTLGKAEEVRAGLSSVEEVVVVPFLEAGGGRALPEGWRGWQDFGEPGEPVFLRLPFDHPLYILFSSGTTGRPKCIVHGAGGSLLQHLKEHRLHTDVRPGDRLFYFTTLGWMMWNWQVSGLASEATLVLYDGNPFHPGPEALWNLVQEEGIHHFGTSAKYLDAVKKAGLRPGRSHRLQSLRSILSTGSPLVPEAFDFVYQEIASDLHLASISGGTDIVSCFVLGCPTLPVWRGEIQCRGLGMKVEIWDEAGRPCAGTPGELVCTQPFPSMPVAFWNDEDGSRYRAAYFEHFPGVWRHGDWAELTEHGGIIIYGRSDATLNPGGVRIGTAEIYRQVEQIPEVLESVVVGQDTGDGDQRVVLFVVLRGGRLLDEELEAQIRRRIRDNASPRHVPAMIAQVHDIPRTRSGKISEIAVREVLHGRPVRNTGALANPESLDEYRRLAPPATGGSVSAG